MSSMLGYSSTLDDADIFGDESGKALYMLEDNANDSTGMMYNGTPTITYTDGKFGRCAVFGGSTVNAKITIPYTFPSGGNSISIWAKVDTANQADGFLFGYSSGARQSMLRGDYNLYQNLGRLEDRPISGTITIEETIG